VREFNEKPVLEGKPYRKFYSIITVKPPFNEATEVREGPAISADHVQETHTITWTVRAKTAQEIDDAKELTLNKYDLLNFEVNFDQENRIRALENKAQITRLQYRNALKARL
jgi:G3E family GTPase